MHYTDFIKIRTFVNNNFAECQAKIEMSYSYQSRNVLFSGFGFYRFASLVSVNTKLETPPPRMVSWRDTRFSYSHEHHLRVLFNRSLGDLFEFQRSTLMGHDHWTIDSFLNHQLRGFDRLLDLIELLVVSHSKVISQRSLRLNAQDRIEGQPLG